MSTLVSPARPVSAGDATVRSVAADAGQGSAAEPGFAASWLAAWNAFWFTPADPLPLAVVRILAGSLLASLSLVRWMHADGFFGVPADLKSARDSIAPSFQAAIAASKNAMELGRPIVT